MEEELNTQKYDALVPEPNASYAQIVKSNLKFTGKEYSNVSSLLKKKPYHTSFGENIIQKVFQQETSTVSDDHVSKLNVMSSKIFNEKKTSRITSPSENKITSNS